VKDTDKPREASGYERRDSNGRRYAKGQRRSASRKGGEILRRSPMNKREGKKRTSLSGHWGMFRAGKEGRGEKTLEGTLFTHNGYGKGGSTI